jgi:hypothetical protein
MSIFVGILVGIWCLGVIIAVYREIRLLGHLPECYRSRPGYQEQAENDCPGCSYHHECLELS